ncbi:MAG: glycosyltransferase family 4 protein [Candidatus Omnitrophica bacterium]|nr:glycosyltransferase family 4 protein [Candidatus Omnitrophota bacterium]
MNILFWVPYSSEGPSNRYRVEQYLPYLEKEGYAYNLRSFWSRDAYKILYKKGYFLKKFFYFIKGTFDRLTDLFFIFKYDMVFIHREAYPIGGIFFEKILVLLGKPYVFDFDDAIFAPSVSRQNSFIERFKDTRKIGAIIKGSRYVIAGNRYLADYSLRYNINTRIIPTAIDTDRYFPPAAKKTKAIVTIGWIGSGTTLEFLDDLKNVFLKISREFGNSVEFKIVGGLFAMPGVLNLSSKEWSQKEELDDLNSFDIGIMPMPENEWTKGKCGFKAILYMSVGIPCICSAVGVNKEIISEGVNGYLASTEKEWLEKLSLLVKDAALRQRLAGQARKTIEEKYSLKINAPKFIKAIQDCYGK